MDLLIFQTAPQPLDQDVVQPAPAAVHADPHPSSFQLIGKRRASELCTLAGIGGSLATLCATRPRGRRDKTRCPWYSIDATPGRSGCTSPSPRPDRETPGHWDVGDIPQPTLGWFVRSWLFGRSALKAAIDCPSTL
jgi:hypothetical protein